MPKVALPKFVESMQSQFPKLKSFDETRLFSVLMQAGVTVEFEFDTEGNTVVSFDDPKPDIQKKLNEL